MNKGITVVILGVLLCAMGMVFLNHIKQLNPRVPVAAKNATKNSTLVVPPKTVPSEIVRIDPPAGTGPLASPTGPVVVTTGSPGDPPKVTPSNGASGIMPEVEQRSSAANASQPASQSAAGVKTSSAAGLAPITPEAPRPLSAAGNGDNKQQPPVTLARTAAEPPKTTPGTQQQAAQQPPVTLARTAAEPPKQTPAAQQQNTPARSTGETPKPQTTKPAESKPDAASSSPTTSKPDNKTTPTAGPKRTAKDVSLVISGQQVVLRIEADAAATCKAFTLSGPDRLVVDLPGAWQGLKAPSVPANRLVKGARLGEQPTGPRLVLDLEKTVKYDIIKQGDKIIEIRLQ